MARWSRGTTLEGLVCHSDAGRYEPASLIVDTKKTFSAWTRSSAMPSRWPPWSTGSCTTPRSTSYGSDSYRLKDKNKDVLGPETGGRGSFSIGVDTTKILGRVADIETGARRDLDDGSRGWRFETDETSCC